MNMKYTFYKMYRSALFSFSLLVLMLWAGTANAQSFNATVDRTTVGQNERFQVYFTFEGQDINGVRNFSPPSFNGLHVLSGPNQSTSMQIINGKVSGSLTYSFILQAPEMGKFTIGKASAEYDGSSYETEPLHIEVVKGSPQQQPQSSSSQVSDEELAKNVFIVAAADKSHAMLGEQITVTYKLYTRLNISSPQINKLPTYQGFWAEELDQSQNILFNIEMYKGERYRVATIKKAALFPSKTGKLTVTPFELIVPVLVKKKQRGNDIFDQFFNDSFFGRTETIDFTAKSNILTIDVGDLPQNNVPESFKGAIGKYNFTADINKTDVELNESITIKVTISGQGNIKLLDVPKLKLPPGFESYDPRTSESINRTGIINGSKTVEYLIVPRVPGTKEIPGVEFTYYDIGFKKYITKTSKPFTINVKKGEGNYDQAASGFSKEDVRLLSEDIRFIKTSDFNLQRSGNGSVFTFGFWVATIIPLIILLTVLGIKKRQDKLYGNVRLLKFQRAEKMARGRLKSAKKALQTNDTVLFVNELSQAIFGYLEDKLSIQKSKFSLDKALTELNNIHVPEELVNRVRNISQKCEFARFAPKGQSAEVSNEMYHEAENIIVGLENSINVGKKKK